MDINDKIKAIRKTSMELIVVEIYLKGLNEQQTQVQKKIMLLKKQVNSVSRRYSFFNSFLLKLILGKYSNNRTKRIDKIKKRFFKAAKELENYESVNESLNYQKAILLEKIKKKNEEIENLVGQIDFDNADNITDDFEGKETIKEYEDLVDYKELKGEKFTMLTQQLDKSISILNEALDKLEAEFDGVFLSPNRHSIVPSSGIISVVISIFNLVEGLEPLFLQFDKEITSFVNLSKPIFKECKFVFEGIKEQRHEIKRIKLMESFTKEHKTIDQAILIVAEYLELIKNIRNTLSIEIEIAQKDAQNFREAQKTFIKNWERGNTESLFDRIHVLSNGKAINLDKRTP